MRALWRRFKNGYLNLNLQTKFTIALISIVVVPACLTAFLFYGRLYSMVVSNTIRQEQDASAKTAPLIERTMDTILATTRNITGQNFFQELFYMPVSDSAEQLATSNHATDFKNAVQRLTTDSIVTDVQIYVDFPDDLKTLDTYPNTENILAPLSQAKGTYWYGIFQGNRNTQEMFCPSFYLGPREKKNYGDMAYICPLSLYYHSTAYKAYLAVYYSDDKLTSILSDNLSLEGSVSYIVNERDAIVATSDLSLSGIYQLDYDTIKASFMSSNNFIERNILDTKVYAGFYSISNTDWFMVTVLPSPPLIHASNRLMIQIVLIYAVFLVLALIFANVLAHSITGRLSSVIRQMQTVRHGPPTPMESPQAHDEIGNLIDTYNYMTRKMEELMEKQAKAAEDLRIAEFNSLQAQINPHFL
ncbi:sensor histidine kinase, partial [Blautia massiliensis (ex Durand et al. 2017)]